MKLKFLVDDIKEVAGWKRVEDFLSSAEPSLRVDNLYGSSKTLLLSAVVEACDRPIVVVTADNATAERITVDLHQFLPPEGIFYFPPSSGSSIDREWPLKETLGRRMEALEGLASGKAMVTVVPCQCLLEEMMRPAELLGLVVKITHGRTEERDRLMERLVTLGYRREYVVEEVGVFAVRGGVLDAYGFGMDSPVRMEFLGDELVSMRKFDIQTQRSKEEISFLHILPMNESRENSRLSPLYGYLPENNLLVFIEGAAVKANMEGVTFPDVVPPDMMTDRITHCFETFAGNKRLFLEGLHLHSPGADPFSIYSQSGPPGSSGEAKKESPSLRFGTREPEFIERDIARLKEIVEGEGAKDNRIVILCDNYGQKERIGELLGDSASACLLLVGGLETGFQVPEANLILYNDHEIFRRPRRLRYRRKYRTVKGLDSLSAINPGDYLVHVDYGVGSFEGLKVLKIHEGEIECLSICYMGGDRVYVPVEKLDVVDKYSSGDGPPPRLDRIGGKAWERAKKNVREGIREMAERLLGLYARRKIAHGYAFSEDTPWQLEMESGFAYEDTPDQRKTSFDVKMDMTRAKPMDRLICGDVGFGKTEIAVRTAFKAMQDNKQVAVLVPTTILAQQHYMTFSERLADFPVVVEVLSRFRTPSQQKKVIEGLAKGTVDIVIGTHRLFSKDVKFCDLGLLVVDEEHRFGVTHKEKLKDLSEGVDVLQMTATPLPRTLHLSLMGIRDISLINTPPMDRLPIVTYVAEFDKELIKEAIRKEVDRGGQVFFVHNRVQSIHSVATMLRSWLPDVEFAVGHGQMNERALEDVMLDFMDGSVDVLVSTMIIGSGLDVPNANTLIVNRSDKLGLAQLYQLRGRVGRSYRRAYAYMFTPPVRVLSEDARKRLTVLEEYTELGSGYQIALRDMDIRGVGNILGREQHGFINAVGVEMYNRLMEEEVKKHQGKEVETGGVELVVELTSLLPEWYVSDPTQRISLYKRLSVAEDLSELEEIEDELVDRFGAPPLEARNLLNIVSIKLFSGRLGVNRIFFRKAELKFVFEEGKPDSLADWDSVFRDKNLNVAVAQKGGIGITVTSPGDGEWLDEVKKALRDMP
jgi:transcription-repair coupling factor (superfamily II helicase)